VRRDELVGQTRALIDEGERIVRDEPVLAAMQAWLKASDELLSAAWGSMDRYHLAWLMVGKPKRIIRGRRLSPAEEAAYVREVAEQKIAALRMSLDAVERQGMPFRGETGGVGAGQGMGEVPEATAAATEVAASPPSRRAIPLDPELQRRLEDVRRAAAEHGSHAASVGTDPAATDPAASDPATPGPATPALRRAPRPEKLQR